MPSPRVILMFLALSPLACTRTSGFEMVRGGSSTQGGGYWFQSGGLSLKEGSPGVLFGMAKQPGGEREFKYVVLIKHRATAESNVESPNEMSDEGTDRRTVAISDGLRIDGKGVDLRLKIEIDATDKTVKREELTFAGKTIDLSKGRVFLLDLTRAKESWEQVDAKLPTKLPDPKQTKDTRELTQRVLSELPTESNQVRDFLKR